MMSDEVADLLDNAADYIEKHGWVQGSTRTPEGRVCSMGALQAVCAQDIATVNALVQHNHLAIPGSQGLACPCGCGMHLRRTDAVIQWNDWHGRTEQEVLDAFRLAAKMERA